ncbi:MAG: hypothetical protein HY075_07460 [Deltaproteobacteria bacterium]|nr:hypothetical protein [Deltaproteobacteria bacterium]
MPGHNIQFLLVDPDVYAHPLVHESISSLGLGRVMGVANLREALIALGTGAVHFVICDWSADPGPELGFLKLMKSQEAYRFIPFLMTAWPQKNENDRVRRAALGGADGYLLKPYDSEQLSKAIEDVLSRYPTLT